MDDFIYSDLENYNDVNDVKELRNENRELKCKLEENATAMDKLQKDFDKISSEFKRLEMNYSSLLKTARAEIERKTQTITILNKERDMMVLNAISKNKNALNIRRNVGSEKDSNTSKQSEKHSDTSKQRKASDSVSSEHKKQWKEKELSDKPKCVNHDSQNERKEGRHLSEDTTSTYNTDNTTYKQTDAEMNITDYLENRQGNDNLKENIQVFQHKDTYVNTNVQCKASSIRNRRKSMPIISQQYATFSSDEACEKEFNIEKSLSHHDRKDIDLDDKMKVRNYEKSFSNKQINKTYETSFADGKHSNYYESSEIYTKNRPSGHYDDRYRTKDKYESSHRHRRRRIPEISYPRRHGDYVRHYNKIDRYDRSGYPRHRVLESPPREKHRSNSRDGHYSYDKDHPYEYERNRRCHQEKHAVKHKLQTDCSEPVNKRMRVESHKWQSEDDNGDYKEKEVVFKFKSGREDVEMQYMSCQSPDYMFTENTVFTHTVKEIRNTPLTHLEDPRVSNKKYMIQTDGDKELLCTVTGKDVDLKVIDTSTWEKKKRDLPNALVNKPMQFIEELVQEIYIDIDNPPLNDSVESGEIVDSKETNNLLTDVFAKSYQEDINQVKIVKNDKNKIPSFSKITVENVSDTKKIFKSTKYTIPKITKSVDNVSSEYLNVTIKEKANTNFSELPNKLSPTDVTKIRPEDENKKEICSSKESVPPMNIVDDKQVILDKENDSTKSKIISRRNIVEGDLILSDDSVDNNQDIHPQIPKQELNKVSVNYNKKQKTRSKSQKNKALKPKRSSKTAKVEELVINKKSEQDEETSKNIKSKFSELFGDSSSLITPEDLELATVEAQGQSVNYIPMFEDAQDALHFNVDGSRKLEARLCKTKAEKSAVEKQVTDINVISDNIRPEIKPKFNKVQKETIDSSPKKKCKKNEPELVDSEDKIITTNVEKLIVEDAANIGNSNNNCSIRSNNKSEEVRTSLCKLSPVEDLVTTENDDTNSENKKSELKDTRKEVEVDKTKEPNVHNNLSVKESFTTDVVKTVIISTGIQQQKESESDDTDTNKGMHTVNDIIIINSHQKIKKNDMEALATSTPHKSCQQSNIPIESEFRVAECSRSSAKNEETASATEQSSTNDAKEEDVPDVRIFAMRHRRRKIIKKTPS